MSNAFIDELATTQTLSSNGHEAHSTTCGYSIEEQHERAGEAKNLSTALAVLPGRELSPLIANTGEKGFKRFIDFFTARIENEIPVTPMLVMFARSSRGPRRGESRARGIRALHVAAYREDLNNGTQTRR